MAGVQVCLYNGTNFKKKANSTKQPTIPPITDLSAGTVADDVSLYVKGIIIEPFSLTGGNIKFKFKATPWVSPNYTYAWIEQFHRFYWITGWEHVNGFWIGSFGSDPLGTARSTIGNSMQYITRCSNTSDDRLIDIYCKPMEGKSITRVELEPAPANNQWDTASSDTASWSWQGLSDTTNCNIIALLNIDSIDIEEESRTDPLSHPCVCYMNNKAFYKIIKQIADSYGTDYIANYVLQAFYFPVTLKSNEYEDLSKVLALVCHKPNAILSSEAAEKFDTFRVEFSGTDKIYEVGMEEITYYMRATIPKRPPEIGNSRWQYGHTGRSVYLGGDPFGKIEIECDPFNYATVQEQGGGVSFIDADIARFKFQTDWSSGSTKVYLSTYQVKYVGSQRVRTLAFEDVYISTVSMFVPLPYCISGVSDKIAEAKGWIDTIANLAFTAVNVASYAKQNTANKKIADATNDLNQANMIGKPLMVNYDYPNKIPDNEAFTAVRKNLATMRLQDAQVESMRAGSNSIATTMLTSSMSQLTGNITDMIFSNRMGISQSLGSGSVSMGKHKPYLVFEDSSFQPIDAYRLGKPYMNTAKISDVSANSDSTFILVDSPILEVKDYTMDEVLTIRNAMAQGFYYE